MKCVLILLLDFSYVLNFELVRNSFNYIFMQNGPNV